MTERELRRLRRADLLELLLAQSRENELLQQQLAQARAQLEERTVRIASAGTLAEAVLQLNGVFEAAQDACSQYIENIRLRSQEAEENRDALRARMEQQCSSCPKWQSMFAQDPNPERQEAIHENEAEQ